MIKVKRDPIVIVGMHRSGTTMLSKLLELDGLFWGNKLGKANHESVFFQTINKEVLNAANISWDLPEALNFADNFFWNNSLKYVEHRLSSIQNSKYWGWNFMGLKSFPTYDKPWGWKDPRTTLLLPLWSEVFPEMKLIHIYRHPIDVALSLKKRQENFEKNFVFLENRKGIKRFKLGESYRCNNIAEGIKVWNEYVKKAFEFEGKIIHVKFEDLINEPHVTLQKIYQFIDFTLDHNKITNVFSFKKSRAYAHQQHLSKKLIESYLSEFKLVKELGYTYD